MSILYNEAFWAALSFGSYVLLAVAIVADLIKKRPRRVM